MHKKIGIIILIVLLILSNIFLYSKVNKSDYDIKIGVPTISKNDNNLAINFSNFKPISNKDEFNLITFYLIDANLIDKPKICENIPNWVITLNNKKDKIQYYTAYIWIDKNSLIIKSNNEQENDYKVIKDYKAKDIIKIIEKYKKLK